jgi:hypothetical protein
LALNVQWAACRPNPDESAQIGAGDGDDSAFQRLFGKLGQFAQ